MFGVIDIMRAGQDEGQEGRIGLEKPMSQYTVVAEGRRVEKGPGGAE